MNLQKISEQLLLALKKGEDFHQHTEDLAATPNDTISNQLTNDDQKNAFWINIYNSYFLILRKHQKVEMSIIYTEPLINIAGQPMSLDNIEHGILRRYRIKKSLGYLPNWFAPRWIKRWAVDELDYRIHFALNCGAASCPPIAFYNDTRIDSQLKMATYSFLESETTLNHETKVAMVSRLFMWYRGDFGGVKGTKKILSKYLEYDVTRYVIKYAEYDYTDVLDNFKD